MSVVYCTSRNDLMDKFENCQRYCRKTDPYNENKHAYCCDCTHSVPAIYMNLTRAERLNQELIDQKIAEIASELEEQGVPVYDAMDTATDRMNRGLVDMFDVYDSETTVFYI